MAFAPKEILLQILSEASSKPISIGKTQLVKLLYLVEVEYFRENGTRLTDLPWLFYHYGPYAHQLDSILEEREFSQTNWETKKGNLYTNIRVAEQSVSYGRYIKDAKTSLLIKKIVNQWASKPLEQLLDYVYFETEPMELVKQRGDALDFSTIKPASEIPPVIPLKASRETEKKVAKLREKIKPFLESMGQAHVREPEPSAEGMDFQNDYIEAMKAWDEEESSMLTIPQGLVVHVTTRVSDSGDKGD